MKVLSVLERIKAGEVVMVTLPSQAGHGKTYSLSDGTEVSRAQFEKIRPFIAPRDKGLIVGSEPQSYAWGG